MIDLAASFTDPDGDSLTFSAVSDDPGVVEARVEDGVLTLTAHAAGSATVTITATDSGGLSVEHAIGVEVIPEASEQPTGEPGNGEVDLGGDFVPSGGVFRIIVEAAERAQLPTTRNFEVGCRDFENYDQAARLSDAVSDALLGVITGGSEESAVMAADEAMSFVSAHVETGECGLFFHGAPIYWDESTERETVWTAILVSGSPQIGRPLRPAERSEWWIDVSVTTFYALGTGNGWLGLRR